MFLDLLPQAGLVTFVYFNLVFLIALVKKKNSIVDVAWGLSYMLLACWSWVQLDEPTLAQQLITLMVVVWGFRLAGHIGTRNWGKPEDFRYQEWRNSWGQWFLLRSYFQIFILQGVLMFIVSLPILWTNSQGELTNPTLMWTGLGVWLFGMFWEVIGDWQLGAFVKNKKPGQILTSGLWKYTRHPNYFGEAVLWWGIFLIALASNGPWWLIISPLLVTYLVRFLSGVPMLERKYDQYPAFKAYKQKTNTFIPWFPH